MNKLAAGLSIVLATTAVSCSSSSGGTKESSGGTKETSAPTTPDTLAKTGTTDAAHCQPPRTQTFLDWDGDGSGECLVSVAPGPPRTGIDAYLPTITVTDGSVEIVVSPQLIGKPDIDHLGRVDLAVMGTKLGLWTAIDALQFAGSTNYVTDDRKCGSSLVNGYVHIICTTPLATAKTVVE